MKGYFEIIDVYAREVLDSRGNPTVEVEVTLNGSNFYMHDGTYYLGYTGSSNNMSFVQINFS